MANIEASTLTYTEGASPNTLPISSTVTITPGDSYVTEVRLMVTAGYAASDLPLLTLVPPSPAISYDALTSSAPTIGGVTVGVLSVTRAAGFTAADAQRLLRALAYVPNVNTPDVTQKRFTLYAYAAPLYAGDPFVNVTQSRFFQVCKPCLVEECLWAPCLLPPPLLLLKLVSLSLPTPFHAPTRKHMLF
jgi:hypothetical protein